MASDMFDVIAGKEGNMKKLGLNDNDKEKVRKIVRLAALLHDVGHSPFSHAGEDIMPLLPKNHIDFNPDSRKIQKFEHEHYSKMAVKVIFKDIIENHRDGLGGIKVDEVLYLLKDENVTKRYYLTVFKDLVSGQADADRADYLLRDSHHLGVSYGHYDKNRLINCMTIGENDAGTPVLAIEEGGWQVAESLVLARYNMFTSVYFHKTRRIYDYHIGEALKEVLKSEGLSDGAFWPPSENISDLNEYLKFDDWKVCGALSEGRGGKHGERILNRNHYKQKGKDWQGPLTEENQQEIEDLRKKYGYEKSFVDKSVTTNWYKVNTDINIKENKTGIIIPLSKKSQIVKQIGRPEITRFYAE